MQMKQILSNWDSPYVGLALLSVTILAFVGFLLGWWEYIFVGVGIILTLWWSAWTAHLGLPGGHSGQAAVNVSYNTRRFRV